MKYYQLVFVLLMSTSSLAQTLIPVPQEKEIHPLGYYQTWIHYLPQYENKITDPNIDWHVKSMNYFNRFLMYAKMQTEITGDILAIFMDGYQFDKHYFCNRYQKVLPLTGDEYDYVWKIYHREKPIMDELCNCVNTSYDPILLEAIKDIGEKDQRYRKELDHKSLDHLKADGSWQKQLLLDKSNLEAIKKIIQKTGYPGRAEVGVAYEEVAFLVIQHSDLGYMKRSLPLVEKAIQTKNLRSLYYAYLFDRIMMLEGKPQRYGTQFLNGKLYRLEDVGKVNQWRKQLGLRSIDPN